MLPAPSDHVVETPESFVRIVRPEIVLDREELVVERQPHRVRARRRDECDVILGDVTLLERRPELCSLLRPNELTEHLVHHVRRLAFAEPEHVAFGIEPVTEIRPAYEKLCAVPVNKVAAGDTDERGGAAPGKCRQGKKEKRQLPQWNRSSRQLVHLYFRLSHIVLIV